MNPLFLIALAAVAAGLLIESVNKKKDAEQESTDDESDEPEVAANVEANPNEHTNGDLNGGNSGNIRQTEVTADRERDTLDLAST